MRSELAILLAAFIAVMGCDKIDAPVEEPAESISAEQHPEAIEFEVDGEDVYYATRSAGKTIHNERKIDRVPLSERGTTFIYVEGRTPELLGEEQRYVANLIDAAPGDRRRATLREPAYIEASESAGLAGARMALRVRQHAVGDSTSNVGELAKSDTFRRKPPPKEAPSPKLEETSGEQDGRIKIESVGGESSTNSLGFADSNAVTWRPVVIYYADWCGICTRAMGWMDEHDVPYKSVDIEASDANRRSMVEFCREKNRSPSSVPTLRIGNNIMKGWSVPRFKQLAAL